MSDERHQQPEHRPVPGGQEPAASGEPVDRPGRPRLVGGTSRRRAALARLPATEAGFTPEQRLLVLDAWRRSGLSAADFAPLVGVSRHTLYAWQKAFAREGPAGLMEKPRGAAAASRLAA